MIDCSACNKNPGDDFQHEYGNLCARCITSAMEIYAARIALDHLMNGDEELVEVYHIMERVDADASQSSIQHVDFHSSTMDMMWEFNDDDWQQFAMSLHASIRAVFDSRVLLSRP